MYWINRGGPGLTATLLVGMVCAGWPAQVQRSTPIPLFPRASHKASTSPSPSPSPAPHLPLVEVTKRAEFFVMIDPSHGGSDKGSVFSAKMLEKELTLAWARDLKRHLEEHGIPAHLLRDADHTLSLEQ